jgi:Rad3-related DNA helicase
VDTWQIILAALGVVLGSSVLGAIVNGWLGRRKAGAETKDIAADTSAKVVESAGKVSDEWQGLYNELKGQIADLHKETADLRERIEIAARAKLKSEDLVAVAKELARHENAALVEQVNVLQAEVEKQGRVQAELVRGVSILTKQLCEEGYKPGWTPPDWMTLPELDNVKGV